MILLFIIVCILYLIMIYAVLSLYYKYRKDIEELEYRLLQLEKREATNFDYISKNIYELFDIISKKEVDNMACKKGRGGRKK